MNARFYVPYISRHLTPDSIVPNPINPQTLNRFSYVQNNPVRYTDASGHCVDGITTWACIVAGVVIATKAIDYGWTVYDGWQAGRTIANPNTTRAEKMMAGLNIGMAVFFETVEPDDLLPIGLPLDDVGRKALMKGANEAFEAGGEVGVRKWVYEQFGDQADNVWNKFDELTGLEYLLKPDVESTVLQNNLVNELFRDTDKYLGGTAGILRRGTPDEIADHMIKAEERLGQMRKILETGMTGRGNNRVRLSENDLDIVRQIYDDLLDAYNGAKSTGY